MKRFGKVTAVKLFSNEFDNGSKAWSLQLNQTSKSPRGQRDLSEHHGDGVYGITSVGGWYPEKTRTAFVSITEEEYALGMEKVVEALESSVGVKLEEMHIVRVLGDRLEQVMTSAQREKWLGHSPTPEEYDKTVENHKVCDNKGVAIEPVCFYKNHLVPNFIEDADKRELVDVVESAVNATVNATEEVPA